MCESPLVSVVIPAFNSEETLEETVQSALNQTIKNIEIIIVDDCSTDNTHKIMNGFDDERVKCLKHKKNRGGSAARNTGISHSEGKYIAFLDSDDIWLPKKLEKQVKKIESKSDQWSAVYCGVMNSPRRTTLGKLSSLIFSNPGYGLQGGEELIPLILSNKFYLGGASVLLIKRELVEKIDGFDESFDRLQDMEFLIRVLKKGKIVYVGEGLVIKRFTGYKTDMEGVMMAKKKYLKKFAEDILELELNGYNILSAHKFDIGEFYIKNGEIKKGFQFVRMGKASHPTEYIGLFQSVLSSLKYHLL